LRKPKLPRRPQNQGPHISYLGARGAARFAGVAVGGLRGPGPWVPARPRRPCFQPSERVRRGCRGPRAGRSRDARRAGFPHACARLGRPPVTRRGEGPGAVGAAGFQGCFAYCRNRLLLVVCVRGGSCGRPVSVSWYDHPCLALHSGKARKKERGGQTKKSRTRKDPKTTASVGGRKQDSPDEQCVKRRHLAGFKKLHSACKTNAC
jgi:hypothetical protein